MRAQGSVVERICRSILIVLVASTLTVPSMADDEPNDACQMAEAIDASSLPLVLNGVLEHREGANGDIDFYRVHAAPGAALAVSLSGDPERLEPVADTLLGYLSARCNLVSTQDDDSDLGSRLAFHVPQSGIFVLAVTGDGDLDLSGDHLQSGGYRLRLEPVESIGAIRGLFLDADTGMPTPDGMVTLYRCEDSSVRRACTDSVASEHTSGAGMFVFKVDRTGIPLEPGSYRIQAVSRDQEAWSDLFTVMPDEDYVVPALYYDEAPRTVGVIRGRVVDATTGLAVSGEEYPFATAYLQEQDCTAYCASAAIDLDRDGYFRFDANSTPPLRTGVYDLSVSADDYARHRILDLRLGVDGEELVLDDIALEPKPVKVAVTSQCDQQMLGEGRCRYRVRVVNRTTERVRGALWSMVSTMSDSGAFPSTQFQAEDPVPLALNAGQSRSVSFEFSVPPRLSAGILLCAHTTFGEGARNAYFDPVASAGFCITAEGRGYSVLSKQESRERLGVR